MSAEKIKVLVVDDSAIVRSVLLEKLSEQEDIEVVGTAPDPYIARNKIIQLEPHVITLDIEMPRMDGLTFLSKLMTYYPLPVIIVSSVTTQDTAASIKALEIGAFDVVNKPGGAFSVQDVLEDIVFKIRKAYAIRDIYVRRGIAVRESIEHKKQEEYDESLLSSLNTTDKLIAIGASTGGTVALEFIIKNLPAHLPPILITQHMPPQFTYQFASRLNELSHLEIKEAEEGDMIAPGRAYVAPGGFHLVVKRRGALLYCHLDDGERVHFQRPAVDVMFHSVAKQVGKNTVAVLLTGMGKDGAAGMLALKKAGAYTIAQDEKTSIVWGMPKTAIDMNAHCEIQPLDRIPRRIVEMSK